jgi:diguanylate cyclase (GGDEF)-like protein
MLPNPEQPDDRAQHAALFHSGLVGAAVVRDGRFAAVNDEFARIVGSPSAQLEGARADGIAPVGRHAATAAPDEDRSRRLTYTRDYVRPDGARLSLVIEAIAVGDADVDHHAVYVVLDVSDRQHEARELAVARALMHRAVDSMSDGFVLFGTDDRIVLCNQVYATTLEGFENVESLVGVHVEDVIRRQVAHGQPVPPEFGGDVDRWVADRLAHHRRADGRPHIQELSGGRWVQSIRHRTPDGGIVVLRSDITAFKHREMAARLLAQHDPLTDLPNRRLLGDRLMLALARARRASTSVAVMLLDLDQFKPVNDTHGHRAGDEVLKMTAERLRHTLRSADTVARYGGDEFVVVIDGLKHLADIAEVTTKVIDAVERPILLNDMTPDALSLRVSCSVGISLFPHDATDADTLIRLADAAMYRAKQAGGGRFAYHSAVI